MSERDEEPKQPRQTARTSAGKTARAAREAEALRANLLKRKRQQRGRREAPVETDGEPHVGRRGVKPV